ncbi:MAG: 50S ribosomal protein L25/general stress protein Ctc [Arenicella sp.]
MSSNNFIVAAQARTGSGTAASRRARKAGQVPCVVYGGGEDDQYILVDHNKIMHQLEVDAFHSSLVKIELDGDQQRAILRDVQMHPWKSQVLHLDFQRVSRKDKITMTVPVHLLGAEEAPGVTLDKGIMMQGINQIDVACLAVDLPEFLEVDVAALTMGESVHLSDLQLPEGVELAHPVEAGAEDDHSVANIVAPKKPQTVEDTEEGAEGEEGAAEGEADAE